MCLKKKDCVRAREREKKDMWSTVDDLRRIILCFSEKSTISGRMVVEFIMVTPQKGVLKRYIISKLLCDLCLR